MTRIGSLFSGYGGLDIGVQAVVGGSVAWHCDVDPGASKILAHHWPDVPNLGDITTVDWARVEPVDVITGGSPCQDVSLSGALRGMRAGTRSGLWSSMCDAIDIIRPGLVVWENVRGVLSAGADSNVEPCPICVGDEREAHLRALGRVVGDLAELGYVGRWTGLRAADVGAPHGRFRVFVAAWPADADGERLARAESATPGCSGSADHPVGHGVPAADTDGQRSDRAGLHRPGERWWPEPAHRGLDAADADRAGLAVRLGVRGDHGQELAATLGDGRDGAPADATRDGWDEGRPESAGVERGSDAAQCGATAAHADVCGRERVGRVDTLGRDTDGRGGADVAWGDYEPAVRRWEQVLGRPAPSPTEPGAKGAPRLSPAFVEWMQGLPAGHVTYVPGLSRNDQLKALGNGVVPQQAAAAVRTLLGAAAGQVAA